MPPWPCYPCFTPAHAPFANYVCFHSLLTGWQGTKRFGSAQVVCSDVAMLLQQIGGHVCTATDRPHPFNPWSVCSLEICLRDPLSRNHDHMSNALLFFISIGLATPFQLGPCAAEHGNVPSFIGLPVGNQLDAQFLL